MSNHGHGNDGGNDRQQDTQQEDNNNNEADFHGNREPERQEGQPENQTPSQRFSNDLSVDDYRNFQGNRDWGVRRNEDGDLVFESSSIYGNQGQHNRKDGDRKNDDGSVTLENGDNDVRIDKEGNITIQRDGDGRELKIGKDGKVTLPNGEEVDADKVLKDRDGDGQTDVNEILQNSSEAEAASGAEATDAAADNAAGTPTATSTDSGTITTSVTGNSGSDITVTGQGNVIITDENGTSRVIQEGAVVGQEGTVAQLMTPEQLAQQYSPEALEQRARLAGDVAGVAPDGRDTGAQGVSITDNGALQWSPGNGQQVTMQDGNITIKDGNRSVTITDGQIAMSNGAAPVTALPDGSLQFTFADGTKMIRGQDGSVTINSQRNGDYYFPRGEQGASGTA